MSLRTLDPWCRKTAKLELWLHSVSTDFLVFAFISHLKFTRIRSNKTEMYVFSDFAPEQTSIVGTPGFSIKGVRILWGQVGQQNFRPPKGVSTLTESVLARHCCTNDNLDTDDLEQFSYGQVIPNTHSYSYELT